MCNSVIPVESGCLAIRLLHLWWCGWDSNPYVSELLPESYLSPQYPLLRAGEEQERLKQFVVKKTGIEPVTFGSQDRCSAK